MRRGLRRFEVPYWSRSSVLERKASAVGPLISQYVLGQPQFTPRRYDRLADEAYAKNVIAYLCVRLIADAVASLRWMAFAGDQELEQHEIKKLLKRQNPMCTGANWWGELVAYHLLAGNAYIEDVGPGPDQPPKELWNLRPDRMKIIPGPFGMPQAYRYEVNGQSRDFPVDLVTGAIGLLHIKTFHPLHDWYGMSPVEAGARYIDMDNAASDLNIRTLQNGAVMSGMAAFKQPLKDDQIAQAEAKIQSRIGGTQNAGKVLILGGDWTYTRMSDTLVDMQWLEGMGESARRICAAWNVPHILVVAGESTYNNRENARVEFWLHTVLPYVDRLLGDLNPWFQRLYGDDELEIRYDRQAIDALEPVRRVKREQARADFQAGILTLNETRGEIDYGEVPDGDRLQPMVANDPNQANNQQQHELGEEAKDKDFGRQDELANRNLERDLKKGETESARQRIDARTQRDWSVEDSDTAHRRAIELEDRRERNTVRRKDEDDDPEAEEKAKGGSNGGWRKVGRNRDGKWRLGGGSGDKPAAGGGDKKPAPKIPTKPTGGLSPAQRAAATRRANAEARLQGADPAKKPSTPAPSDQKPLTAAQKAWLTRKAKADAAAASAAEKPAATTPKPAAPAAPTAPAKPAAPAAPAAPKPVTAADKPGKPFNPEDHFEAGKFSPQGRQAVADGIAAIPESHRRLLDEQIGGINIKAWEGEVAKQLPNAAGIFIPRTPVGQMKLFEIAVTDIKKADRQGFGAVTPDQVKKYAVHEIAHALDLSIGMVKGERKDWFISTEADLRKYHKKYRKMGGWENTGYREQASLYAATNPMETFAEVYAGRVTGRIHRYIVYNKGAFDLDQTTKNELDNRQRREIRQHAAYLNGASKIVDKILADSELEALP
ncbi:MAG: hypothetical protein RJA36_1428 [Pseudomonadota bacterium]|jgi:HK97 family phage portal protein